MKNSKGGRTSIEYTITVTMAKELAMVENNQKGTFRSVFFVLELLNCGIIGVKASEPCKTALSQRQRDFFKSLNRQTLTY